ncbi:MAG: hypothetical protein MUF30_10620 [Burkholderiales bacterium]|nr:hypothetical protein [Burkholderiales bacterium]
MNAVIALATASAVASTVMSPGETSRLLPSTVVFARDSASAAYDVVLKSKNWSSSTCCWSSDGTRLLSIRLVTAPTTRYTSDVSEWLEIVTLAPVIVESVTTTSASAVRS